MVVQPGLCRTQSETRKTDFLITWLKYVDSEEMEAASVMTLFFLIKLKVKYSRTSHFKLSEHEMSNRMPIVSNELLNYPVLI